MSSDEVKVKFVADTTGLEKATVPSQVPVAAGAGGGASKPPSGGGGSGGGAGGGQTPGGGGGSGGGGQGGGGSGQTPGGGGGNTPRTPVYPWTKGWGNEFKKDLANEAEDMLSGINLLTVAANQTYKLAKEGIEYAQKVQAAARFSGLSTNEVQQYGYAAKMSGVEFDVFVNSVANANKELGKLNLYGGTSVVALHRLGVNVEGVKNHSVNAIDVLKKMADAYKNHGETAEMAALGNQLFGSSFRQMIPMLKQGSAEIEKLAAETPILTPTEVSGAAAAGRLGTNTGKRMGAGIAEGLTGFAEEDRNSIRKIGYGTGGRQNDLTPEQRANYLLGRKDESFGRAFLNLIGGFKSAELDSYGVRGAGETTSDVIAKYEEVFGKDKEKMPDKPREVYEALLKIRDKEEENKPDLQSGIFQAASKMQQVGGGDVLSAISRVDFAQQTADNTSRTADAVERIANAQPGGGSSTPPPPDTTGPVAK